MRETVKRQAGEEAYDPLTGAVLPPYPTEEERHTTPPLQFAEIMMYLIADS